MKSEEEFWMLILILIWISKNFVFVNRREDLVKYPNFSIFCHTQ